MARVSRTLRNADFHLRRLGGLDAAEVSKFLETVADEVAALEDVAAAAEAALLEIESHRASVESTLAAKERQAAKERTSAYARAAETLRDAHRQALAIVEAARVQASTIGRAPAEPVDPQSGATGVRLKAADAGSVSPCRRATDAEDAARLTAAVDEARAIGATAQAEADQILAAANAEAAHIVRSERAEAEIVRAAAAVEADAVSTAAHAADRIVEQARRAAAEHVATVANVGGVQPQTRPGVGTAPNPGPRPRTSERAVARPVLFDDARPWPRAALEHGARAEREAVVEPVRIDRDELVDLRDRRSDGIGALYASADEPPRLRWWSRPRGGR